MRTVVLLVLLAGCGPALTLDESKVVDDPDTASDAVTLLAARYGVQAPRVHWYGAGLDCQGGLGWTFDDRCVFGGVLSDHSGVVVAWPGVDVPASSTAVAHELAHWRWGDADHALPGIWGGGGDQDYEPGTAVGDANAALQAAGL
jgi:hypothetical protein